MVDVNTGPYFLHPFKKCHTPKTQFSLYTPLKLRRVCLLRRRQLFLGTFLKPFNGPYMHPIKTPTRAGGTALGLATNRSLSATNRSLSATNSLNTQVFVGFLFFVPFKRTCDRSSASMTSFLSL